MQVFKIASDKLYFLNYAQPSAFLFMRATYYALIKIKLWKTIKLLM